MVNSMLSINIAFSLFLSFFYFYLYRNYAEKYMGLWAISWFSMGVRIILDFLRLHGYDAYYLLLLNQFFSMSSAIFLLYGVYQLHNRKPPKTWIFAALLSAMLSDSLIFTSLPFSWLAFPTALYVGLADIWAGIMFYQIPNFKGLGNFFLALLFVVIGVENTFYPLIPPTYFFSISSIIWIIININILILYFEKSRQELIESEEKFRLLAENAKDIIFRYTINGKRFEYISPSVEKIIGYTVEDVYEDPFIYRRLLASEDLLFLKEMMKLSLSRDITKPLEFNTKTKSGNEIWIELQLVPIQREKEIIALEGIIRDITERINVEKEMKRLNQLHVVGQTAATIAHEIRNPMTTVYGFLQVMSKKEDMDRYKEWFDIMTDELGRANHIIKNYLSFSKQKEEEIKEYSLNEIIFEIHPLIESNAFIKNMNIKLELQEIPNLHLNKKEIRQLILNLAQNGLEAMEFGGTLTIQTWTKGQYVYMSINDNGIGMSHNIIQKLGTPFFTTKENGTGLGLPVCYKIAEKHKAKIFIDSGINGTKFTIVFDQPNIK